MSAYDNIKSEDLERSDIPYSNQEQMQAQIFTRENPLLNEQGYSSLEKIIKRYITYDMQKNLTKHLFCVFLGYLSVKNKSYAHFSIALYMQIMKRTLTQFLDDF